MPLVYLSVGSNIGDREANVRGALLGLQGVLRDMKVSGLYETEPMYVRAQPRFLNAALRGVTELAPEELLGALKRMEAQSGRRPTFAKGPRVLDIDILLYGRERIAGDELVIPHPAMTERAFVLVPLLELEPRITEPSSGVPYRTYLDRLDRGGVRFYSTLDLQGTHVGRSDQADLPAG